MHIRKSPRASRYDYTSPGTYFVTICTKDRVHYFGEVKNGIMVINDIGKYCYDEIKSLPEKRKNVEIGEFMIMPNHVHIIIIINEGNNKKNSNDCSRDASIMRPLNNPIMRPLNNPIMRPLNNPIMRPLNNPIMRPLNNDTDGLNNNEDGLLNRPYEGSSLGSIIKLMKGNIIKMAQRNKQPFARQPRYHDHIIRDQNEQETISQYIQNNPKKWSEDKFNI